MHAAPQPCGCGGAQQSRAIPPSGAWTCLPPSRPCPHPAPYRRLAQTAGADSSGAAAISSEFDAEAQAFGAAARSNRALEELFHSGGAVLAALVSQREGLKGAQRRALDVLHALGLSDSLLRATDRRQRADRALVTACSLFTLAVFLLLLWLVRGRK